MLTADQRLGFSECGVVRLKGLIPREIITTVRNLVLEVLERHGVWANGTWCGPELVDPALTSKLMRPLKDATKQSAAFKRLQTGTLIEAATDLMDNARLTTLTDRPQLLLTPPNAREWTVPHKIWHLDVPRLGEPAPPGVQAFAFLAPVAPGGGGTLIVAGSHRLLNDRGRIRSKDVKARLKREDYFRELMKPAAGRNRQHFLDEPGHVGAVELQVVELTGEPGDVYFTDLRVLHTLAPNATDRPRLMVTQRFFLENIVGDLYGGPNAMQENDSA